MTSRTHRADPTILKFLANDLAVTKDERDRLYGGLEAVVNAGERVEDYRTLASQWREFWPHGLRDGGVVDDLNWSPDAQALFVDYRDKLRKLWAGDPEAQHSSVLAYLLGIINRDEFLTFEYVLDVDAEWFQREATATHRAWLLLLQSHPNAMMAPHSMAFPLWGFGNLHYLPKTDFERALWWLSQENWRARVCGPCGRHFIADKAAQRYCSTRCYGEAKRGQRLAWWKKAGKIRRSQRRAGQQRTAARQKSRARG